MTIPRHETPEQYRVSSVYQSIPDPDVHEEGYEVQVALLPTGEVQSLLLLDHGQGNLLEMPPEVAMAIAHVLGERLSFEGARALLTPAVGSFDPEEVRIISVYRSSPDPAMQEDGYDLHIEVCGDGEVEQVSLHDHVSRDRVDLPPEIARSIARTLAAYPLLPRAILN